MFSHADHHGPAHRIAWPDLPEPVEGPLEVTGDEAHHAARVKRLTAGARVELVDGRGRVVEAEVLETRKLGKRSGWMLRLEPHTERRVEPLAPRVEVCSEPPKGAALEHMIDQLSQAGAAAWAPLACARTEVDPRAGKLDRLERTAQEASKQCGRAWWLTINPRTTFDRAIRPASGTRVVVADASGGAYLPVPASEPQPETIRLIVGPVGGLTRDELDAAREAGAEIASFGALTMRVETAAAIASALILDRARHCREP